MDSENSRIIVANITWNPDDWKKIYTDPKAGHRYARSHPGHESLNFNFDKVMDTGEDIFGYVQWTNPPQKLATNAIMIFYTNNLQIHKGQIVGIYGNVKLIDPVRKIPYSGFEAYKGFENDKLIANITPKRTLSLLFPKRLDANKYSQGKRKVMPSRKLCKEERLPKEMGLGLYNLNHQRMWGRPLS